MPPFKADDWLPHFAAMRVELAMRQFIRKTQSGFEKKYGNQELIHTGSVQEGKEYRFVIERPDIPLFEPFTLNVTENACGKVNPVIPNDEGWEWTFNYTVKVLSGGLKGEKELAVRYEW